jgi:hypothetical protein
MNYLIRCLFVVLVLLLAISPAMAQDDLFQTNTPEEQTVTAVTPEATAPVIVAPAPDDPLIPASLVDEILVAASEQSRQVLYVMGFIIALFIVFNMFPALRHLYNSAPVPFKNTVKEVGLGVATTIEAEVQKRLEAAKLTDYDVDDEAFKWLLSWAKKNREQIEALGNPSVQFGTGATYAGSGTITNRADPPQTIVTG